jgi:hypothetical protein
MHSVNREQSGDRLSRCFLKKGRSTLQAPNFAFMNEVQITRPELGFIVITRAMLRAGVALLLADRLGPDQRKAVGVTLALIGAITTIPALLAVFAKSERKRPAIKSSVFSNLLNAPIGPWK